MLSELHSSEEDSRMNIFCLTLTEAKGCLVTVVSVGESVILLILSVIGYSVVESLSNSSMRVCFFLFLCRRDLAPTRLILVL